MECLSHLSFPPSRSITDAHGHRGRHHGLEGFREFTNPKGLVRRGTAPDLIAAFGPPYAVASAIADHAFAQAAAGSA